MANPADLIRILSEFRRLKTEIHDWNRILDHISKGTKPSDALKQKMLGDEKLAGIGISLYKQDYISGEKLFALQQAYEQQALKFCHNIDDALATLTEEQKKSYAKELNDIGALREKNEIFADAYKCYLIAAENTAVGKFNLGRMREYGLGGATLDLELALSCYRDAADLGIEIRDFTLENLQVDIAYAHRPSVPWWDHALGVPWGVFTGSVGSAVVSGVTTFGICVGGCAMLGNEFIPGLGLVVGFVVGFGVGMIAAPIAAAINGFIGIFRGAYEGGKNGISHTENLDALKKEAVSTGKKPTRTERFVAFVKDAFKPGLASIRFLGNSYERFSGLMDGKDSSTSQSRILTSDSEPEKIAAVSPSAPADEKKHGKPTHESTTDLHRQLGNTNAPPLPAHARAADFKDEASSDSANATPQTTPAATADAKQNDNPQNSSTTNRP